MNVKRYFYVIYWAFCLSFFAMLILSMVFYSRWQDFSEESDQVEHTYQVLRQLNELEANMSSVESAHNSFLLTGDSTLLKRFQEEESGLRPAMAALRKATADNPRQRDRMVALQGAMVIRMTYMYKLLYDYEKPKKDSAQFFIQEGRKMTDKFRSRMKEVEEEELALLAERSLKRKKNQAIAPDLFKVLMSISMLLSLFCFLIIVLESRKRMTYQRALEAQLMELDRNNKELEQLNYASSHHLQEPLRKITVFADRLKAMIPDDQKNSKETAVRIHQAASRMRSLIEQMMAFTNLARSNEEKSNCNLHEIIEHVCKELEEPLSGKLIHLDPLPNIVGYAQQLKQCFTEIINNSIQFSDPEKTLHIQIRCKKVAGENVPVRLPTQLEKTYYEIRLEDNGIGFDNAYAEKIFLLFQQLDKFPTETKGSGVGLAMVRRVMVNHDGTVYAEGEPGKGTKIFLYFPCTEEN